MSLGSAGGESADLVASLIVEVLTEAGGGAKAARLLADAVNCRLAELMWGANRPVGRALVEEVLRSQPARFELLEGGGWRLADAASRTTTAIRLRVRRPDVAPLRLYRWQERALVRWRAAGRHGIVAAVTGAGKTHVGLAAIEEHLEAPGARAVVLVPTVELLDQWRRRLRGYLAVPVGTVGEGRFDRLDRHAAVIYVARSAADVLAAEVGRVATGSVLLVADECHRYGAPTYARALEAQYGATLGLSATPERDHDSGMEQHVLPALGPVVFSYDHDRAVSEQVVADFRVAFVGVEFAPPERLEHERLSTELARTWNALAVEYPYLERARNRIEAIKILAGRDDEGLARRWLSLAGERRRLLYGAAQRHDFVSWLASDVLTGNDRAIVFHESIADCEELACRLRHAGIAASAHHSELSAELRGALLGRFKKGELRAVVAPRTLDEGIDVPDASLAVIVAATQVKRQNIQRVGRVLRRTPGKSVAAVVKVFVRGAADDPAARHPDRFSRLMLETGRGRILRWPEDGGEIARFVDEARRGGAA